MSIRKLHEMVGRAVLSEAFCAGILNGHRAELIHDLGLEPNEVAEVMAIRATTLPDFAAAVELIIHQREADLRRALHGGVRKAEFGGEGTHLRWSPPASLHLRA